MEKKILTLAQQKLTKSTAVYDEVTTGQPPVIRGLHLPLWYTGTPAPQKVQITIEQAQ